MSEPGTEHPGHPDPPTTRRGRTWPQRVTIGAAVLGSLGSFSAAGAIYVGQQVLEDRNLVVLDPPADDSESVAVRTATDSRGGDDEVVPAEATPPEGPPETFPAAEPAAKNFLVTGADNNACIEPDSPFAGAFGNRSGMGERSDTIMVWRVNPAASQAAVLSFPRDLWVTIAGTSRKSRINSAYRRDEPQELIDTIEQNFGVPIDHYVQVDFCAFKALVDGAGGVEVPFTNPVRDPNTGLNVTESGCFRFDGEHALAYVRSRYLEELVDGEWRTDPSSDLGRVSRQQDFIRRVIDSLLARGAYRPDVVRSLIETSDRYVTYDNELTAGRVLELAGVLRNVQDSLTTYQIEAVNRVINGNAVLEPRIAGANMQSILAVFRGEATLAAAPDQVFDDVTTTTLFPPDESDPTVDPDPTTPAADPDAPPTTAEPVPFETLPEVVAEENTKGVTPDPDISCG